MRDVARLVATPLDYRQSHACRSRLVEFGQSKRPLPAGWITCKKLDPADTRTHGLPEANPFGGLLLLASAGTIRPMSDQSQRGQGAQGFANSTLTNSAESQKITEHLEIVSEQRAARLLNQRWRRPQVRQFRTDDGEKVHQVIRRRLYLEVDDAGRAVVKYKHQVLVDLESRMSHCIP